MASNRQASTAVTAMKAAFTKRLARGPKIAIPTPSRPAVNEMMQILRRRWSQASCDPTTQDAFPGSFSGLRGTGHADHRERTVANIAGIGLSTVGLPTV